MRPLQGHGLASKLASLTYRVGTQGAMSKVAWQCATVPSEIVISGVD